MDIMANSEDPDKMSHKASFLQDLSCLLCGSLERKILHLKNNIFGRGNNTFNNGIFF